MKNTEHPLWRRWCSFRNACNNQNNHSYQYYGARGLGYDPNWDDFWTFVSDVEAAIGPMPNLDALLDRIDNDKGFYKDNIFWGTRRVNANNRQSNHKVTYNGKTQSIADWSKEYEINFATLWSRIIDHGMDMETALNLPLQNDRPRK